MTIVPDKQTAISSRIEYTNAERSRLGHRLFRRQILHDGHFCPVVVCGFRAAGTRNWVWQCWHFTTLPRSSSMTLRNLRQRRFGQINWTVIRSLSRLLSVDTLLIIHLIGEKSVGVINFESTFATRLPSFSDSALAAFQSASSTKSFHAFSRASLLGYARM